MPSRDFTDPNGQHWTVWDTTPTRPQTTSPQFRKGWLSFKLAKIDSAVCRLAPIPEGWEHATIDQLHAYLKQATASAARPSATS